MSPGTRGCLRKWRSCHQPVKIFATDTSHSHSAASPARRSPLNVRASQPPFSVCTSLPTPCHSPISLNRGKFFRGSPQGMYLTMDSDSHHQHAPLSKDRSGIPFLASVQAGFTPRTFGFVPATKSHQKTALQGPHLSTMHNGSRAPSWG